MAPHSSTLAWKIPWTEEPGRLQSLVSLRVGDNWETSFSLFTFMHWRRKWKPTPVFLPGESQGQRSLVGLPSMGVAQSPTRLKWRSGSSSIPMWVYGGAHLLYPFISYRHLGYFFVLAIINNAAMKIEVCISFQSSTFSFFGDRTRNGIAGSDGSSIFSFWRILILFSIVVAPI